SLVEKLAGADAGDDGGDTSGVAGGPGRCLGVGTRLERVWSEGRESGLGVDFADQAGVGQGEQTQAKARRSDMRARQQVPAADPAVWLGPRSVDVAEGRAVAEADRGGSMADG